MLPKDLINIFSLINLNEIKALYSFFFFLICMQKQILKDFFMYIHLLNHLSIPLWLIFPRTGFVFTRERCRISVHCIVLYWNKAFVYFLIIYCWQKISEAIYDFIISHVSSKKWWNLPYLHRFHKKETKI